MYVYACAVTGVEGELRAKLSCISCSLPFLGAAMLSCILRSCRVPCRATRRCETSMGKVRQIHGEGAVPDDGVFGEAVQGCLRADASGWPLRAGGAVQRRGLVAADFLVLILSSSPPPLPLSSCFQGEHTNKTASLCPEAELRASLSSETSTPAAVERRSIAYHRRLAGALGMLYFFILAHQADFDVKWCRGTTGEMIFKPWVQRIEDNGAKVLVEK